MNIYSIYTIIFISGVDRFRVTYVELIVTE